MCDDYQQCADDEFCNSEQRCQGPTRPSDEFLSDLPGDSVQFEHRGIINSTQDMTQGNTVQSLGSAQLRLSETTYTLDVFAYAYRATVPDTHPNQAIAGKEVIGIGTSTTPETDDGGYHLLHLNAGIAVDELLAMKQQEKNQGELPAAAWLRIDDITVFTRDYDQSEFKKICTLSELDLSVEGSQIFLSYYHNAAFDVGEDLQLWGNIALGQKNNIGPQTESSFCRFYQDGTSITGDDYEHGIALTTPELSCEVPSDFLEPAGSSYATVVFTGTLNDVTIPYEDFEMGVGVLTAAAGGNEINADDLNSYAYHYASPTTDIVVYQTVGSVQYLGVNHYTYNMFRLMILRPLLLQMKTNDEQTTEYDPNQILATLENIEEKDIGQDTWTRKCLLLISDTTATDGALLACHQDNTSFTGGEPLEIAAQLTMTDESAALQAHYGIGAACYCYVNETNNLVDCDQFEAQQE